MVRVTGDALPLRYAAGLPVVMHEPTGAVRKDRKIGMSMHTLTSIDSRSSLRLQETNASRQRQTNQANVRGSGPLYTRVVSHPAERAFLGRAILVRGFLPSPRLTTLLT